MNKENEVLVIIEEGTNAESVDFYSCCWSVLMMIAWI
jgi:hypothetical protein